jgi:hypothetical protein
MFEMDGLKMISYPRKYRRGGGVAIIANLSDVNIQVLDIPNQDNLEIIFAIIRPKQATIIKEIITYAFYCPPRSRKKSKYTDFIATTVHSLLTVWPQAGVMGGGDRNDWNVSPLLSSIPRLQNLQMKPTLNGKNLDIFLSTLGQFYSAPDIVPSVPCDDPIKGVPSDHSVPVLYPLSNLTLAQGKEYVVKTTRPLPESGIRHFGQLITQEQWDEVEEEGSPEEQETALQVVLTAMLDKSCPTKTVKLHPQIDKPVITQEMKILDRPKKGNTGSSEKHRNTVD